MGRLKLEPFRAFPDHHAYTAADLSSLRGWATGLRADLVVTTLKDLVKIRTDHLGDLPLFAIEVALDILAGQDLLESLLAPLATRAATAPA